MRGLHMIHSISQLDVMDDLGYTHIVVNPGFTDENLEQIRKKFPKASLLQTVNCHSIPSWGPSQSRLYDLRSEIFRGNHWSIVAGLGGEPEFIPIGRGFLHRMEIKVADIMAWWCVKGMKDVGFDGVYFDDCFGQLPGWLLARAKGSDLNQISWDSFRDALLRLTAQYINQVFGDASAGPIICNTAGFIPDFGVVDGICIEKSHAPRIQRLAIYKSASDMGIKQNIDWYDTLDVDGVVMPGDVVPG